MTYAAGTTVTVEKSKAELERLIRQHGGYNYGSATLDAEGVALVHFAIGATDERRRHVRLHLPLPKQTDFTDARRGGRKRTAAEAWEQSCRERWRVLVLAVRAKLELIEAGGSTIDREFLADLALPDGSTVSQRLAGPLAEAYSTGRMPPLLAAATSEPDMAGGAA